MSNNTTKMTENEPLEVIDLNLAVTQVGHSKQLAMELLKTLCIDLPNEMKLIKTAYDQNDSDKLENLLHKMQGGLYYCGVPRLLRATTEFHIALKKSNSISNLQTHYDNFIKETETLLKAYSQLEK